MPGQRNTSLTTHKDMPYALQTIQYSVIGVLLIIAGLHTLFFRGARYAPLGCQPEVQHSAKLDTSLLVGIQQLRYEQRMLQADRDKLLGTAFSQVLRPPGSASVERSWVCGPLCNHLLPRVACVSLAACTQVPTWVHRCRFRRRQKQALRLPAQAGAQRYSCSLLCFRRPTSGTGGTRCETPGWRKQHVAPMCCQSSSSQASLLDCP